MGIARDWAPAMVFHLNHTSRSALTIGMTIDTLKQFYEVVRSERRGDRTLDAGNMHITPEEG
jgi:hypothetical protein